MKDIKDKFKEIILDRCNYSDRFASDITETLYILHQQAMKEERAKRQILTKENKRLKVIIFDLEDEVAEMKIPSNK